VLAHARLWFPKNFSFGILKCSPRFCKVANGRCYARAFFLILRFLEIGTQALGGYKRELLEVNDLAQ
jgi:hypothetical protein